MKINTVLKSVVGLALLLAVVGLLSLTGLAQDKATANVKTDEFCNNWNSGDGNNVSEVREYTVPGSGSLTVDGGTNGGVSVIGADRSDILVRACVQAWGKSEDEARAMLKGITVHTGATVSADSAGSADRGWGVSYRIYAPRNTNLKLTTHNGGIKIDGMSSIMEFEAMNGGIKLSGISGSVKGRTMNGGVKIDLGGKSWNGTGLDVQTTNGGVKVVMPENYGAHVETGTVNGGFKSDIAGLVAPEERQNKYGAPRAVRINTDINGGGPTIRVVTTNGGVIISSEKDED